MRTWKHQKINKELRKQKVQKQDINTFITSSKQATKGKQDDKEQANNKAVINNQQISTQREVNHVTSKIQNNSVEMNNPTEEDWYQVEKRKGRSQFYWTRTTKSKEPTRQGRKC